MTPPFVAVLPAIMPDLARRCIQSMAPELRANLLLVDNTTTGEIADEHAGDVMFVVKEGRNTGVTHAWEDGRKMAVAQDVEWLVLVSQSMEFGSLGGMDLMDAFDREPHCVHSQYAWHYIAWNMRTLDIIGPFDEVAFPIMGSDTDLLYRAGLAGLPSPRENGGEYTQLMLNAQCAPDAATLRAGVVRIRYADHLERYRAKFGGPQGRERWTHPYNLPELDWTFVGDPPGWSAVA